MANINTRRLRKAVRQARKARKDGTASDAQNALLAPLRGARRSGTHVFKYKAAPGIYDRG